MVETVLATVLAIAEMRSMAGAGVTIDAAVVVALAVITVATASRVPVVASVVSLLLVASTFITDASPLLFSLFFSMLIVEVVAACGYLRVGALLAVAHWALAAVDTVQWTVTTDPVALAVVAIILLAAYVTGWSRANHERQREKLRESLIEQEELRRRELAQELHDSVATSLTSVVMQSQALPLIPPDDESQRRHSLESISDSSREALAHLRTMLQMLNDGSADPAAASSSPSAEGGIPAIRASLHKAQRELEAHSMGVVASLDLPPEGALAGKDTEVTAKVLAEMTSNATKHAPRYATVFLECTVDGGELVVSMTNPMQDPVQDARQTPHDHLMSGGLGLESMRTRADRAGGSFTAGVQQAGATAADDSVGFWRATLRVPIIVIKS